MTGTPDRKRTVSRKIKDHNDNINLLWRRRGQSNRIQTTGRSIGSGRQSIPVSSDNFIRKDGDTVMGALGWNVNTIIISTDAIDIAVDDNIQLGRPLPTVFLQPESGTTDDLITINGAKFMQQELWIRGVNDTVTITVKNSGNIRTHDGADFDIVGKKYYKFIYDIADVKWVQATTLGTGGGGGGPTSFPAEHTITNNSDTWTGTQTLDMGVGDGHTYKWIIDQALMFTSSVSNIPSSGTQRTFELEFVHDGVGGTFTVTLPSNFSDENGNTLTSFDISGGNTAILSCRINDGTNFLVLQKNVVASVGGFSGNLSDLTIDVNKDWDDRIITNIRALNFSGAGGTGTPTVPQLTVDSTGDMIANVATGDSFFVTVNDVIVVRAQLDTLEVITPTTNGPEIRLRNDDQAPTDNKTVGDLVFRGNDDALGLWTWGRMEIEQNDVSAGAKQGSYKVFCQSDNTLDPILDYSGSDAVFRFSSGVDVVRANRNNGIDLGSVGQSWKNAYFAGYSDFKSLSTPTDPASGTRRIFTDSGSGELSVRTNAGTTVSLEAGAAGGEANTASNLGAGSGVFGTKVSSDLRFKSLVPGTGISFATDANEIEINTNGYINSGGVELDIAGADIIGIDDLRFDDTDMKITQGSGIMTLDIGNGVGDTFRIRRGTQAAIILDDTGWEFTGSVDLGFYGTSPISQQTGVAVTAAGIHAALVNLGLITA